MRCDYSEALHIEMHVHTSNLNIGPHGGLLTPNTKFGVLWWLGNHLLQLAITNCRDGRFKFWLRCESYEGLNLKVIILFHLLLLKGGITLFRFIILFCGIDTIP